MPSQIIKLIRFNLNFVRDLGLNLDLLTFVNYVVLCLNNLAMSVFGQLNFANLAKTNTNLRNFIYIVI